MFCANNKTTVPKESCNQPTNKRLNQPIYESMYQWIDRWVALWIGVMTVCRCLVMGANPPATLQGLPTTCAQWRRLGRSLLSMHTRTATLFATEQEAAQKRHCPTRRSLILILSRWHFEHDALGAALCTHLGNITELNWLDGTLRGRSRRKHLTTLPRQRLHPPKTPICIHGQSDNVLREEQVPQRRQPLFLEGACVRTHTCCL